jgi:hypothetical protein
MEAAGGTWWLLLLFFLCCVAGVGSGLVWEECMLMTLLVISVNTGHGGSALMQASRVAGIQLSSIKRKIKQRKKTKTHAGVGDDVVAR